MSALPAGAASGVQRATPTITTGARKSAAARPAARLDGRPSPDETDDEPDDRSRGAEPHHPGRSRLVEDVVEVPGVGELEDHASEQGERRQERADEAGQDAEPAREAEREREEAGRASRLREGDHVRQRGEEERDEHDREHGERAPGDVRRPAPPRGQRGEREEEERGHRDCASPGEHLDRKAVARVRADVQLPRVLGERAPHLLVARRHRRRLAQDGDEPEHEQHRRDEERRERREARAEVLPRPEDADEEETAERDPEEDRVRRVDDGEREPGSGHGGYAGGRRPPDRLERERERGRNEELVGGGRGQGEKPIRAPMPRREAHERHLSGRSDGRRPHPAEERPAGLVGDDHGERREERGQVQDDEPRIRPAHLRDDRVEAVPEREGVARMQPAVRELDDAVQREVVEGDELPYPREVE